MTVRIGSHLMFICTPSWSRICSVLYFNMLGKENNTCNSKETIYKNLGKYVLQLMLKNKRNTVYRRFNRFRPSTKIKFKKY